MRIRRRPDASESLASLISRLTAEAVQRGADTDQIAAMLEVATNETGELLATQLKRTAPKMLRHHGRVREGFERRLRKRWREALDLYECVLTCCLEAGEDCYREFGADAEVRNDHKFHALTLLHVRACLVASEIHALLRTGHGVGAQARWRTLHELAVTALVLGENDEELSERFLLHRYTEQYRDAERYQQYCKRLGYDPFTDGEMEAFRADRQSVVDRFGPGYQRPWGWAKPLFPSNIRPDFSQIEELAGIEHLRPWVQLSHHTIHSGATGALHVRDLYGKGKLMLAGPSDSDLADPAQASLVSLSQVTTAYLLTGHPGESAPERAIALRAISLLLQEASNRFTEIELSMKSDSDVG